ncbi:hypothetical protein D9M70_399440 [compost metagenome]
MRSWRQAPGPESISSVPKISSFGAGASIISLSMSTTADFSHVITRCERFLYVVICSTWEMFVTKAVFGPAVNRCAPRMISIRPDLGRYRSRSSPDFGSLVVVVVSKCKDRILNGPTTYSSGPASTKAPDEDDGPKLLRRSPTDPWADDPRACNSGEVRCAELCIFFKDGPRNSSDGSDTMFKRRVRSLNLIFGTISTRPKEATMSKSAALGPLFGIGGTKLGGATWLRRPGCSPFRSDNTRRIRTLRDPCTYSRAVPCPAGTTKIQGG